MIILHDGFDIEADNAYKAAVGLWLDSDRTLPVNDLDLCACCAALAANGDTSGCRDFWNHPAHALQCVWDGPVYVADTLDSPAAGHCDGCGWDTEVVAIGGVVR